jgi:hypothetical protein
MSTRGVAEACGEEKSNPEAKIIAPIIVIVDFTVRPYLWCGLAAL